jgi:1-acyl-sn-glycerol-3-phosphate acyltransferase
MLSIAQNNQSPQSGNAFSKWIGRTVFSLMGWQLNGAFPSEKKYVICIAPHTSNWDFVVAVALLLATGLKVSFLAKHSLFIWPFSMLLHKIGAIGVNRASAHGVVGQMVEQFNHQDKLILAIAPEGTRATVKQWKVGFIHIAHGGQVPILPMAFDYAKKQIVVGSLIDLCGDIETDLTTVKAFYLGIG